MAIYAGCFCGSWMVLKRHSVWFALALLCSCAAAERKRTVSEMSGKQMYTLHCMLCHGEDGTLGNGGAKNLATSNISKEKILAIIKYGSANGLMRPFGKGKNPELNAMEIDAVTEYILKLRDGGE